MVDLFYIPAYQVSNYEVTLLIISVIFVCIGLFFIGGSK